MKNKIIVLQGPPASGKSFYARTMAVAGSPYVIVSRDSIREGRGEYCVPSQENYISDMEEYGVRSAIKRNLIPIIDATNLHPETIEKWENLAKELNCEIEYKQFYVPFKEALERDKNRSRPVGEKVLKHFYRDYCYDKFVEEVGYDERVIRINNGKRDCVVLDLDATVCLHRGRLPYDWDKIPTDESDPRIQELVQKFNLLAVQIVFLTGRPKSTYELTDDWLHTHFPSLNYKLLMRESDDFRSGEIVKKEIWETYVEPHYNTLCVFEDSNKCVDMWRELGLLTCQVANGDY